MDREDVSGQDADKVFFTVKEAADLLKVAERTLTRLLFEKKIGGYKVGRQWRMTKADIEAMHSAPAMPQTVSDVPQSTESPALDDYPDATYRERTP